MEENFRYGSERLASEQVEKGWKNYGSVLSTPTPEPLSEVESETSQPVTIISLPPALLERGPKRQGNNINVLANSKPLNTCLEAKSDLAVETPQPTILGPSASAPPTRKRKRATDFSDECEPIINSIELESTSGFNTHQPITGDLSQAPSQKRKRKSNMLRQLDSHNKAPEPDSEPDIGILHESIEKKKRFTRSASRKVASFLKGKTPTPRKILNVDTLMDAELGGTPIGTETRYFPDDSKPGSSSHQKQPESRRSMEVKIKEEDEEEILSENLMTSDRGRAQSKLTHPTMFEPLELENFSRNGEEDQTVVPESESAWSMWDHEKRMINELLNRPGYGYVPSWKSPYPVTPESPEGFQGPCHVVEGLHIFTPTAADFMHFKEFLEAVEEVAGRKLGVVKVIVPSERLLPTFQSILPPRRAPIIKTVEISLSLNEDAAKNPFIAHNMRMRDRSTTLKPEDVLHMIQRDKEDVIEECVRDGDEVDHENVWRGNHALRPYSEEQMFQRCEKDGKASLCGLKQLATHDLRAALKCKEPNIEYFPGNRFSDSRTTEAGLDEPVFNVATGPGPLSPLQMNKYAAYSLNYHHSGAPRILMVTRPGRHTEVETALYDAQDSGNLFLSRPEKPSTCSQFVAHESKYVPSITLSNLRIPHTEVVQQQGELVIIFPWAYHEAYTSGPNITEEIMYAGRRCKAFHGKNLYRHCSTECAGGQPDDYDLGLVFFDRLNGPGSDPRNVGRYRPD